MGRMKEANCYEHWVYFHDHTISDFLGPLGLTLSQTTNFRLFQTERVCRRQFQIR